jgi:drug/metabolite transporter (DMT)-like permease
MSRREESRVSDPSHRRALLFALFVTVLWSSSWIIIRFGLDDEGLTPLTFAGLRYGLAAIVLAGVVLARPGTRARVAALRPGDWMRLTVLGIVMYTLTQGAQFVAIDNQPAATTSLVLSMTPLAVAIVAGRSLGERPLARQVVGAALVATGAGLYFSGSLQATAVGMVAAAVALLSNVGASLLGRSANRDLSTSPLVITTVSMGIGAAVLFGVGVAAEGVPSVGLRGALIIAWLAIVNGALAFTLWNHSLRHLTATESAVVNNTMLVQIAALAWIFLGETPSAVQMAGIALVTLGVTGSQYLGVTRSSSSGRRAATGSDTRR